MFSRPFAKDNSPKPTVSPVGSTFVKCLADTGFFIQGFRLNLGKRGTMIIFESLLNTFEVRSIF